MEPQKPTTPIEPNNVVRPSAVPSQWSPENATPNMPASAPAPTVATTPGKKKSWMLAIIIAAVILLLGGGVAAAYFGYVVPNKPDNVLKAALVNSFTKAEAKRGAFNGEMKITGGEGPAVSATFSGAADSESGAFKLEGSVDAVVSNVTFDLRSVDGKNLYMRVGGLDGLPQLLGLAEGMEDVASLAPMIAAINNQWLEINESLLNQATGGNSSKLSDADLAKLGSAYEQNQFLSVKEKLADEKINNLDSYHYKVAIDKAKLKSFVQAVKDANISSLPITSDQLARYQSAIDKADFDAYPFDMWISKSSKLLTQLTFKVTEEDTTFDFRLTMDSYGQPVTVEKPEGAKSVLELMGLLLGAGSTDDSAELLNSLESGISL